MATQPPIATQAILINNRAPQTAYNQASGQNLYPYI
jgi:hypothetical protein